MCYMLLRAKNGWRLQNLPVTYEIELTIISAIFHIVISTKTCTIVKAMCIRQLTKNSQKICTDRPTPSRHRNTKTYNSISLTSRRSLRDWWNCFAFDAILFTVPHRASDFRSAIWLNSCFQSATSTVEQWRCISRLNFWRTLCRERAFGWAFPLVSYSRRCHCSATELRSFVICIHQQLYTCTSTVYYDHGYS